MSQPRRRIIHPTTHHDGAVQQRKVEKLRSQLQHARANLLRWQKRLRRAFGTVERLQKLIDRLDRRWRAMHATLGR